MLPVPTIEMTDMLREIARNGGSITYMESSEPFPIELIDEAVQRNLVLVGPTGPYTDYIVELTPVGRTKIGMAPSQSKPAKLTSFLAGLIGSGRHA